MENNSEVIPIETTGESFFKEYLLLKKPLLEYILGVINKRKIIFNTKMIEVLSYLLYYNYIYKDMEEDAKWDMIFNSGTKKQIADKIGISLKNLNTYISLLRSVKVLNEKTINKPFIIYPDKTYELTFKFILSNGQQ